MNREGFTLKWRLQGLINVNSPLIYIFYISDSPPLDQLVLNVGLYVSITCKVLKDKCLEIKPQHKNFCHHA